MQVDVCETRRPLTTEMHVAMSNDNNEVKEISLSITDLRTIFVSAEIIHMHVIYKIAEHYEGRKEMFYLTTHSTHFIYGYMASDIW